MLPLVPAGPVSFPRTRGDEPARIKATVTYRRFSPHARG